MADPTPFEDWTPTDTIEAGDSFPLVRAGIPRAFGGVLFEVERVGLRGVLRGKGKVETKSDGFGSSSGPIFAWTSTSANAGARNWIAATSWDAYGDLVFRVSNAKDGDPSAAADGTNVLVLNATGGGFASATTASSPNVYQASSGSNFLRSTSSARYKRNVETLDPAYADALLAARPVWYRSAAEADNPAWGYYGLIAEELAEIDPRLVHWAYQEDQYETVKRGRGEAARMERRPKKGERPRADGVQYERLTVLLLDLVRRQGERIAALEARLDALEG